MFLQELLCFELRFYSLVRAWLESRDQPETETAKMLQQPYSVPLFLTRNPKKHQEMQLLVGSKLEMADPASYGANVASSEPWDMVQQVHALTGRVVIRGVASIRIDGKESPDLSEELAKASIGKPATILGRVYFCNADNEVLTMYNDIMGTIREPVPGVKHSEFSFGWDRWFVPIGYNNSVAEMGADKAVISYRAKPAGKIAALISNRPFKGIYEGHITVAVQGKTPDEFKKDCTEIGLKAILIELQSGVPVNGTIQYQTGRWYANNFQDAQNDMLKEAQALKQRGYTIVRLKIETTPNDREGRINCPITDEDVSQFPPTNYFEFHVKTELHTPAEFALAAKLAQTHLAHLSRNAFKKIDGGEQRFLTLRLHKVGRDTSFAKIDALVAELVQKGIKVLHVQREYAVWDTNVDFDRGWIA